MGLKLIIFTLLSTNWFAIANLHAAPQQSASLRDQCRNLVAGAYLSAFDKAKQQEKYWLNLKSQRKKLDDALNVQAKRVHALEKDVEVSEYNVAKEKDRASARQQFESLQNAIAENAKLEAQAKADHEQALKDIEDFKKRIDPAFVITSDPDMASKPKAAYPIKIEYRTECPKFRYLCPLPRREAASLMNVLGDADGDACRKYANYSGIE